MSIDKIHNESSELLQDHSDSTPESLLGRIWATIKKLEVVIISGVGFFSDAYDLFVINIVLAIINETHSVSSSDKSVISSAVLAGALVGQLIFGAVADKVGRRKGFIITLSLVITGTIASAFAYRIPPYISLFYTLAFIRFFLGIGIGGEYPLSATITLESSEASKRGRLASAVFSMQGVGAFGAAVVSCVLLYIIGGELDIVWRLCLGLGALPGIATFYFRYRMPETEKFNKRKKVVNYRQLFRENWKKLVGTAGTWLLFDITFYANGLFSTTLLDEMGVGDETDPLNKLRMLSQMNIVLTAVAIPGYWAAVWLIEIPFFGRKNLQLFGFIAITLLYLLLGVLCSFTELSWPLMLVAYSLSFFFSNLGPNTTTYVLAAESFPTEIRATAHGISAAAGKLGAVIGAALLAPVLDAAGVGIVFLICALIAAFGTLVTAIFIEETYGREMGAPSSSPVGDKIINEASDVESLNSSYHRLE